MVTSTEFDYLRVLYALAWADGKIVGEEAELLTRAAEFFHLSEEQHRELDEWAAEPRSLSDLQKIDFSSWIEEQKIHVYLLALEIAKADGVRTQGEGEFLQELRMLLGLKDESDDAILARTAADSALFGGEA